jgi:hypothetical protein
MTHRQRNKAEPGDVSRARLRLARAKKRVSRQAKRLERLNRERRDTTDAAVLLKALVRRQVRCGRYLQMVLGWSKKNSRKRFPRKIKNRFMNPQSPGEAKGDNIARWDKRVRDFLDKEYAETPHSKASLINLWQKFLELGLPNAHFVSEFTSGKKEAALQRSWEMMLACHLDALGFVVTTSDEGPDFRIEHNGHVIWIEAISPQPMGLPSDYLQPLKPGEFRVGDVPHNEVLLRWTSAIKEKSEKLKEYRAKGIVGPRDSFVIAINGCQLGTFPLQHGVSQFPYAVEAVYAAGPITFPIDKDRRIGKPFVSIRPEIRNAKGAPVPTALFVDRNNAAISAVIAFSKDRSEDPTLALDIVHNHFASSPVPQGILGNKGDEWITEPDGKDGIDVFKRG